MDHELPKQASVNKLSNESSPYLLQHATNLVNWFPWGAEAIELARRQEKPILLSIGYSACHWCHVMMHESFCDPDIAATMNRLFINIKVDKEERPDLDKIYQIAYQLLMGRPGGWPLTMFLAPASLIPYFGGTYFPNPAPPGLIDFATILHKINDVFYHDKEKIKQQESHIRAVIAAIAQPRIPSILPLASDLRRDAELVLQREFDPVNSGFGHDAKFPNCPSLEFLLHSKDPLIRHIALTTLKHMAQGGIYDQLSGGFFRYTVDPKWRIPHFEKMLYDNGQLLSCYAQAYALTKIEEFKKIACETADWLEANMRDPSTGGFYTSIDADSEDEEGLYYVWDRDEIKTNLNSTEYTLIKKYYQLDHKANFDDKWHLIINPESDTPSDEQLKTIKDKLLKLRALRTKPHLDKKILCAWNALVIQGLNDLSHATGKLKYLDLAEQTIIFIRDKLFLQKRLFATWQDGAPKVHGFSDDYAFLLNAVFSFTNNNIKHKFMPFCIDLADSLIDNFFDTTNGGFYYTANDEEQLFYRPKIFTDDAIPSGNGVACLALLKLGKLLDRKDYIDVAQRSIYTAQFFLNDAPEVHLGLCEAYELAHD